MSPRTHASVAAAALLLSTLAAPALAEGGHEASITNVRITLVDLDPNDGIAPAISFAEGGFIGTWLPGDNPGGLVQTPFALGDAASVTRSAGAHTVSFSVLAGSLLGPGVAPGATAVHSGNGPVGLAGEAQVIFSDFTLTPQTRIEIRAFGSASTAGYAGAGGIFDAWAGAGLNLFSRTLQLSYALDFVNAYSNTGGPVTPFDARELYSAYDNAAPLPFTASVSAVAYVGAQEAAPVPEPAAWLLMATGLLALPRLRRR